MSVGEAWAAEPDMDNRDPNSLNDHLKVTFEEVIGEPDHTRSIDCCWKFSFKCFNLWKTLCYIIVTVLCAVPHAICWGCTFACIAFDHIWQVTPCFRCIDFNMSITKKCFTIYADACCAPWCDAMSGLFGKCAK